MRRHPACLLARVRVCRPIPAWWMPRTRSER
jgi:hypothetical protein